MHTCRTNRRDLWLFLGIQLTAVSLIAGAFLWRALIDRFTHDGHLSGCLMHDLLHIYCPFCGGTRAMVALCRGQWLLSLKCNPVSAYLAIGFAVFDVKALVHVLRRKPLTLSLPSWYLWGGAVLSLLVFIVRNTLLIGFGYDNLGDLAIYWA